MAGLNGEYLAAVLTLVAVPGCAVIPIPHQERPVASSRPPPSSQSVAALKVGSSTRADVLLALGPPSERWNHDGTFVYAWTTSNLAVLWGLLGGPGGIIDSPINHFLVMEFDDSGRLIRSALEMPHNFQPGPGFLEELRKRYVREAS